VTAKIAGGCHILSQVYPIMRQSLKRRASASAQLAPLRHDAPARFGGHPPACYSIPTASCPPTAQPSAQPSAQPTARPAPTREWFSAMS